jgi:hypothetical protein
MDWWNDRQVARAVWADGGGCNDIPPGVNSLQVSERGS